MQGLRKRNLKKVRNLDRNHSRKSVKSDNLHVPMTPSTFRKINTSTSRATTPNSKSVMIKERKSFGEGEPPISILRLSHTRSSELPENVAVHFSSFYQNEYQTLPHSGEEKPPVVEPKTLRNFPKMEFTRQMVHKLEHFAGTQNYGRQVSAVLEDTVEAPGFDLKLPPVDNCSPFIKNNDYYPLWYKDPNKIPQISGDKFQEMKKRYNRNIGRKKSSHGEEDNSSEYSETETESEEDEEEEDEEEEEVTVRKDYNSFSETEARSVFRKSTKSSSLKEDKNHQLLNIERKSISKNSSDNFSWYSETSGEFKETKDAEEESLDWETEEEEEIEVEIVHNFEKKFVLDQF